MLRAIEATDMAAELAHFAVLRPEAAEMRPCGDILDPSIDDVRDGFSHGSRRQSRIVAY